MAEPFVVISDGLVQNTPTIPVYDLDVLASDFTNDEVREEIAGLRDRLVRAARENGPHRSYLMELAGEAEHALFLRGAVCATCEASITSDGHGGWVDATGGDGCDESVHTPYEEVRTT